MSNHSQKPIKVIAISSGKGGVGKTNITVNLALSMMKLGCKVAVLDADLGLANIDVVLGLRPKYNLSHVVRGEKGLEEIIVSTKSGLRIIPASSGVAEMTQLSPMQYSALISAFSYLTTNIDTLIIDTGAGISDNVCCFNRAAQQSIVVVCNEPASITDAYALIKTMNKDYGLQRFHVLSSMAKSSQDAKSLFLKLANTAHQFLDVQLNYLGMVPFDEDIKKAVQKQRAVVEAYPRSKATEAFKNIAKKADNWSVPVCATGHIEFFVERLIHTH